MAGLDHQLGVGMHEGHGHRHLGPVGKNELGTIAELLDHREDVVPASGVEPGGVLPQLVEDLIHLEGGEDVLDEHRRLDGAPGNAEAILSPAEHVVPQPGLEVGLQLGKVEVGAGSVGQGRPPPVIHVEAEVEERRRHGTAVHQEVLLVEVPSTGPDHEGGHLLVEGVVLGFGLQLQVSVIGGHQVGLTLKQVLPGG